MSTRSAQVPDQELQEADHQDAGGFHPQDPVAKGNRLKSRFPPGGDYRAWAGGVDARRALLASMPATILACSFDTRVAH